jgi:hypothetical protein
MAKYFNNALPGSCIPEGITRKTILTLDEAKIYLSGMDTLCLGHEQTCHFAAEELGRPVEHNRLNLPKFEHGDSILVYQYRGPRLPEGVYTLPEGASFTWELYEFMYQ